MGDGLGRLEVGLPRVRSGFERVSDGNRNLINLQRVFKSPVGHSDVLSSGIVEYVNIVDQAVLVLLIATYSNKSDTVTTPILIACRRELPKV